MYKLLISYAIVLGFFISTIVSKQISPPKNCSKETFKSEDANDDDWKGIEAAYLHWPSEYQKCFDLHGKCYQLCRAKKACCDNRLLLCIREQYSNLNNGTSNVTDVSWNWHPVNKEDHPFSLTESPTLKCNMYLKYQSKCSPDSPYKQSLECVPKDNSGTIGTETGLAQPVPNNSRYDLSDVNGYDDQNSESAQADQNSESTQDDQDDYDQDGTPVLKDYAYFKWRF
ncbi:hypothetical protein BDF19DRAFT_431760 [Syncephalis fuscata]|nr:hypothetical protein BDF19DRAFT_431760 [Syncephalis fuscata]